MVGCGRIAANHFSAIERHADRMELTGVCDNDPAALARAVEKTQVQGFSDLDDLLSARVADVVALCTPSGLHPSQAVQSARAGVHVMTEKGELVGLLDPKMKIEIEVTARKRG